MACPASPALLTLPGPPFGACAGGASLDNSFGETPGWNGPNQGYRAWNRWFPTDRDFVPPGELSARARDALRRTIGLLEKAGGAPFINKWQRNATRAQALHDILPEAVFLHLRRNGLLTTQSVLPIGRASCRERGCQYVYVSVVAESFKKKNNHI